MGRNEYYLLLQVDILYFLCFKFYSNFLIFGSNFIFVVKQLGFFTTPIKTRVSYISKLLYSF